MRNPMLKNLREAFPLKGRNSANAMLNGMLVEAQERCPVAVEPVRIFRLDLLLLRLFEGK